MPPRPFLLTTASSSCQPSTRLLRGALAIQRFLTGLLAKVPDSRFENVRIWIETPDRVFGEYDAKGHALSTGKLYKQTYAGVLVAEHSKIKLLHEALDTLAASRAFSADGR